MLKLDKIYSDRQSESWMWRALKWNQQLGPIILRHVMVCLAAGRKNICRIILAVGGGCIFDKYNQRQFRDILHCFQFDLPFIGFRHAVSHPRCPDTVARVEVKNRSDGLWWTRWIEQSPNKNYGRQCVYETPQANNNKKHQKREIVERLRERRALGREWD